MGPTVTFLISIGLCLGWAVRAQMDPLSRPTLSVVPSPVVSVGADVTFRCQGHQRSDRFQLWKNGELREERDGTGQQAEFVLRSVEAWRDGGRYRCRFEQGSFWSGFSEPLDLLVTGVLPKPSISVSPGSTVSEGTTVTISCQVSPEAPAHHYSFVLLEAESLKPLKRQNLAGTCATFSLPSVRPEDTGSYSCIYYKETAPHKGSHPSETLELTVPGLLSEPTLWAHPGLVVAPGASVTLWCSRPKLSSLEEVTFTLWKAGTQESIQKKISADFSTGFFLPSVGPQDTGNYSCTYMENKPSSRGSKISDAVELLLPDAFPKPTLSVWPGLEVESGANVTLLCQGPSWVHGFFLYKDREEKILPNMDNTQNGTKFILNNLTPKDSGTYSCSYQIIMNGSVRTQCSEPLQLIVTGTVPSSTLFVIIGCVSFLLLLCLVFLAIHIPGSIFRGTLQGESPRRCFCYSWSCCLSHQPQAPRGETVYTAVAKERPREALIPMAEDPQGVNYVQLNFSTMNERKTDHMKTPKESTVYYTVSRD